MINSFRDDKFFLSNFYLHPIAWNGLIFPASENAFQSEKTLNKLERIPFTLYSPGRAKRKGKKLILREDWEEIKVPMMFTILLVKFSDPELRDKLLATDGEELIEGNNWHDNFWGACECIECQYIEKLNKLGILLMEVRDQSNIEKDLRSLNGAKMS
jgi:ribA/ribD-fused uncharacterized protein